MFTAILLTAVQVTADGEDLIGTWEMIDAEGDIFAWQFRADGIMIENDYYDGELVCVYVFPYEVNDDELTVGEGLNWEVDEVTGELVPYEDFDDGEISLQYGVAEGELTIILDDLFLLNIVLSELLDEGNLDTEDLSFDLEEGDLDDLDLSDDQIQELFDVIYVLALFGFLSEELGIFIPDVLDDVSDDADVEDLIAVLQERPDLTALLDVTWPEPPEAGSALYSLPNVVLSSHLAGSYGDEVVRMADYAAEEIEAWLAGKPLRFEVTAEMLDHMA